MRVPVLIVAAVAAMMPALAAAADDDAVMRGQAFTQANCARCHAIGKQGASPLKEAPPFRELHRRYPVEEIQESLAEGIVTAHPAMPQFQLDVAQINDLIAYLKSLEP